MRRKLQKTLFIGLFFLFINSYGQDYIWKTAEINGKINNHSVSSYLKNSSKTLILDFKEFKKQLKNAPLRGAGNRSSTVIINLPDDKGVLESFRIIEAPVFAPSLSAKYPNIKSFVGYSEDNSGAVVRMSVSHKGVQTMISYKNKPTVFMQPLKGEKEKYLVYSRVAKANFPQKDFVCSTLDEVAAASGSTHSTINQRDADDQVLRKFRFAISVNGEYTAYHGGTVEDALAAINATMTRNNAIYEVDMAVTFEVQDFPSLIYTDAATDPYSGSLSNWNVELQNTLTTEIGNAAYDIGHMFGASGGYGNAGCIGCVCRDDTDAPSDQNKGAGITSPSDGIPEGDNFDVDYVAHEIGHQMGANHTFSHNTEGSGVNSEPGSGTTIMGYAGITGANNVQQHSDAYFHYHSIRQITDNITNTRTCWQDNSPITLTNNPPNANAGNDYTIPQGTAYVLRGAAADADAEDNLMYCWEGSDSGQVTNTNFGPTRTIGAMARSLPPTTSADRYIPKLSSVISGNLTQVNPTINSPWETVATVARDINWALTVRDRELSTLGLGGLSSFDTMTITVDDTSGPFVVTSQTTNETWFGGTSQMITWDVAGTDSGAVNSPTVNILMSTDGGASFPFTVVSGVANDGSETINVPVTGSGDSDNVRILVEGNDHVFFAVNSSDISLRESEIVISTNNNSMEVCSPNDAVYTFTYNTFLGFAGNTTFSANALPSGAVVSFSPAATSVDGTLVTATITGVNNIANGSYDFEFIGASGATSGSLSASLNVLRSTFDEIILSSPQNNATNLILTETLAWSLDVNASSYDLQVATDALFTNIIVEKNTIAALYTLNASDNLLESTSYYWRVKAKNICGESNYSTVYSFTTQDCSNCISLGSSASADNTSTTLVKFNTIDNASGKTLGYNDLTDIKTEVKPDETHILTVHVNTDGLRKTQTKVWIDWNQNCNFNDAGEEYDLGSASEESDDATSLSSLSIIVPNDAEFGEAVMRVSTRDTNPFGDVTYPTSCGNGFRGEVEDYTILVVDATASIADFSFNGFNIYPNPTKGTFTLNLEVVNTNKVSVQLFDVRGRLIGEKNYFNTNINFSESIFFEKASTGLYLVKITNGNKQTTRKLLIK